MLECEVENCDRRKRRPYGTGLAARYCATHERRARRNGGDPGSAPIRHYRRGTKG